MSTGMFEGTGGSANTKAFGSLPLTDTAQLWASRKSAAESLKENHEADWARYWRWYMNWVEPMTDPQDWWRSNVPDPQAFKVIETLLPKHILGMFQKQEWFTVKGREASDDIPARKAQALLEYMVDRMDMFPKLYECVKYALIMGHAWGKVTWKVETEDVVRDEAVLDYDQLTGEVTERQVRTTVPREVYNDPWFEWLMIDQIWADPTGKGRWYIEQIETTLEELRETNEADGTRGIYKNLDLLELTGSHSALESFDEVQEGHNIPRDDVKSPSIDGQRVTLWQCWGWVPKPLRGPDGAAWRLTVIGNGIVEIRDVPITTPDNRPPYFPIRAVPIPGRLYGESVMRWVGPQIDLKSRLANMRMDEVTLGVWQQYVYDRDAVSSNKMFFQPGGALPVDTSGGARSVRDLFAVVERRPIMGEVYLEDGARQKTIEDTSAATPGQQGVADTSRQTATEISVITARGDQRFVLATMWLDHSIKKPLLTMGFKNYQRYAPEGRIVRILGPGGTPEDAQVSLDDLEIPLDIDVKGGLEAFGREARRQSIGEFIQLSSAESFAPYFNVGELLTALAEDQGWTNPRRFVKTDDQVNQERQESMKMQVQMAQMQVMLETQSKIAIEQAKGMADVEGQRQALMIEAQKGQLQLGVASQMAQIDLAMKQQEAEINALEQRIRLEGARQDLVIQLEKARIELATLREKSRIAIAQAKAKPAATGGASRRRGKSRP